MNYVLITYIVIPVFWLLDGFFISRERQYRELYENVITVAESEIDFSLDASMFNRGINTWCCGVFSKTLVPFYLISISTTVIIMVFIK